MHDNYSHLEDLDLTRLPSAPQVLIHLIDLFHQPEVSFEELNQIIQQDSALCARVISIANSAAYSQWKEVRDLKRILVVLGSKTIKSIALTTAVHQFFSQFSPQLGETLGSFWLDALICAHLSRSLAELTGYQNPDEAHVAGLLHQLGQLVFLSNEPEQYLALLASTDDQSELLLKEQQRYGINSADLAADIITHWGLSSLINDAVRFQHKTPGLLLDAKPLLKLVNLSSQLCNRINHTHNKDPIADRFFALNQSVIDNLLLQATESAVTDAAGFGIRINRENALPTTNIDDETVRIELARSVRHIALLDGMQSNMMAINDLSDLMRLISENLQLLFGLSATLFFFPNKDQSILTGVPDSRSQGSPEDGYSIQLKPGRSLISEAALQGTILDSQQQTLFAELPVIDCQIASALKSPRFLCLPLIHQQQLINVIAVGCSSAQSVRLEQDIELLTHFLSLTSDAFVQLQNTRQESLQQQQERDIQQRKIIHEVSNPLTVINNYLEILEMDLTEGSATKQHIETIKGEIERIGGILLQLRNDSDNNGEGTAEIDINLLITRMIDIFEPTFYKLNQVQSRLELDPALPLIATDPNKLKQILSNLIKNAAEALPEQGIISIKTKALVIVKQQQYIEIGISDNGKGIPSNLLDRLFQPVESTKGKSHSGLGLTIVSNLIKELKGHISYSASPQGGAEFTILLPKT